jgi:class 3 adenylate cyclase/tetratricopeptide (TPR) repeat protein
VHPYAGSVTCPACGATTPDGARFCPSCGQELLGRTDERRVVTVLFADLVGFTGLAEVRDPEQVKVLVDRCFEALVADIKSFGGRVDKIVGDAIVALFGAPIAHEDDPERAVRTALRMQETLRDRVPHLGAPVQMRIGVNTGEVLVGALRAGGDYTAMGDVVNTASRLQTAAAPGQVLVGGATHAATSHVIEYEPMGRLAVRGRGDAVEAYQATGTAVPPGHRHRDTRTPLIGRAGELGLIAHALDGAVERRRASLVTLIGEAGVGKARLAQSTADLATDRHGALVLRGRCVAYGESNVWWAVAEAVRASIGVGLDESPTTVHDRVAESLTELFVEADPAEVERVTNGLVHLMGVTGPLRGIDPTSAREEVHRSVARFIEGHLAQRPVMLVIADLHWARPPVLELLTSTLDRLAETPFVLVTTARPPFPEAWTPSAGRHNTLVVNVDPLDRDGARALLDALSGGSLDEALTEDLLDRSGGNPLFLEELVALVSGGGDGGPGMRMGTRALPDTLRGLVAARLDGLSRPTRRTLEDAAVYGRSGAVEALVLMAMADRAGNGVLAEQQVRGAVDELVTAELLQVDDADNYTFRSDLVRDVTYTTLTKAARALRHYGIGEYLETHFTWGTHVADAIVDGLAHHYGNAAEAWLDLNGIAGIPADIVDRALSWITEGATRAESANIAPVAERLFDRAIALLPPAPSPRRVAMILGRANARAEMRDIAAAHADVEEALFTSEQIDDHVGHANALLVKGSIEEKDGDLSAAVASFEAAEQEFTLAGDRKGNAEALRLRGLTEMFAGNSDGASRAISAALDAFGALGDSRGQAWALQNLAWMSYLSGRPSEAERRIDESLVKFGEIGDSSGLGWALALKGWVRFHQGRWEEAEAISEPILADAASRSDRWAEGMMLLLTASIRLWSGRAEDAIDRAKAALEMFRGINDIDREVQAAAILGRAHLATGAVGEGFRTLDLAIDLGKGLTGTGATLGPTIAAAAAVAVGDPERALRAVALVSLDGLDPSVVGESDRLVALGLALAQMGQVDDALVHLEHAVSPGLEEEPSGYAMSSLACARALAGDVVEVEALCTEVVGAARATYSDKVSALLACGSVRMGRGDAEGAAQVYDRAEAIADGTDDRVSQAVVRVARAAAGDAVGFPDEIRSADASARLAELGVGADGWRRLHRGAALAAGSTTSGAM